MSMRPRSRCASLTENPRWAGKLGKVTGNKVTKVMGKAPAAGPPKSARGLQSVMTSNHAELKLVAPGEVPNHGPSPPVDLNASFGVMAFEVRGR